MSKRHLDVYIYTYMCKRYLLMWEADANGVWLRPVHRPVQGLLDSLLTGSCASVCNFSDQ